VNILAVIPARYSSTRLPGKVLSKDTGKFLIQHTYEQVCKAKLPKRIIIAADDEKIIAAAQSFGAECMLTSTEHQSGTDRIAEVASEIDAEIIVNVQADEPEIDPASIDKVAQLLVDNPQYPMATLAAPVNNTSDVANPNIVKVVISSSVMRSASCDKELDSRFRGNDSSQYAGRNTQDEGGLAIYFSRSPIPYDRQMAGIGNLKIYLRHLGIYAYLRDFLLKFTTLPQTPLEKIEKLEQLRAIENGYRILVGKVEHTCDGIDTPQQYAEFVKRYKSGQTI
jgi:3-deoxy-manno-octulosonate cytidylyltransferase (CMP-KDO synthetase)